MQDSSDPLVSILTPSLNQGRYLPDCLASVRAQTYGRLEHLVKDGGSTDGTVELLRRAGGFVSWDSRPDSGQAGALNGLFESSAGEIVGWVNSDDGLFAVDSISRVVEAFRRWPSVDVVYGDVAIIDSRALVLRHHRAPPSFDSSTRLVRGWSPLNQPSTFVRRSAVQGQLLDEGLELTLDLDLWLRLSQAGCEFRRLPRVLAADRDHRERKVRTIARSFDHEWDLIADRYGLVLAAPSVMSRGRAWFARWAGLAAVLAWTARYERAFDWRVDSRRRRVWRQLATTHAKQTRL